MAVFPPDIVIRGRKIRSDVEGRVSLNDIHAAAGFEKNRKPHDWIRLPNTSRIVEAVLVKITGKSRNWDKNEIKLAYYAKVGEAGGTYADPRLALAYAEYLNPKLAVEVREVFLRFKAADASLADDILQRAPAQDNEWAGVRALGRAKRNEFTQTLSEHGVKLPPEYAQVTNATYQGLTGKTAAQLKVAKGLAKSANLRDAMPTQELVFVMAAEQLAKERIVDENSQGASQCSIAAQRSAMNIKRAIDLDRADRKTPNR